VILTVLSVIAAVVALLALLRAALVCALARRHARAARAPRVDPSPPVSLIVPAFNEAAVIEDTVRALAASTYPLLEIVVVDDGSTDDTAAIVQRLGLACVRVVRQANTGKAQALNTAIAAARHDVIVSVDADTVFEPDTVAILVDALAAPGVGAVAGNTKVANRAARLGRWQHIEYVIGFNLDRRVYGVLGGMPTVPGAVGAFRRAALEDVGLFSNDTLAEDTDVTIALGRAGWRVAYEARAIAHTEAPATVRGLWRQRVRWTHGTLQSVHKHRAALRRAARGPIGRRGLPYLVVNHMVVALLAPSIDLLALHGLLIGDALRTLGWLLAYNALSLALAAYAFRLDGEPLRPLWSLPAQQLAHRQLVCLVLARCALSTLLRSPAVWQRSVRAAEAS
jgi:poly-beta-1,6 N-acetyl-D-glucosamine synthase